MQITVSRIKVTLPRRRTDLLSRPRLNDLIEEFIENRLILVLAPAGYGKTSLLIEVAHTIELPFCWYNLDRLDQDLFRFVAHFIAAIDQRFAGFNTACAEAIQAAYQNNYSPDNMARLVAQLVYNQIGEHMVLVLDDYHLIDQSSPINTFLNRFIQEIDESFHLVILSRTMVPFVDLPLLVARSEVGGLGLQELVFQPEEIQNLLLQNYKQVIPESLAKELAEKSEGWITGLLLSAQTMWRGMADRERIARVSGVNLDDYLIHQILEQQPDDVRDFLLRTSLFDEFNAGLCADVFGPPPKGTNWQSMITKTLQYNLFVLPIGEDGSWLRYHQLFRDFLQKQLVLKNPDEYDSILRSLAKTFMQRQDWVRAYDTLKRLDDTQALVEMLEIAGEPMVRANQLSRLAEWLDALPPGLLETRPKLTARRGIVAATLGETHWGLTMLNKAVEALREENDTPFLANTLVQRALVNYIQTDHTASMQDVDEVLTLTENGANLPLYQAEAKRIRGLNYRLLGDRNEATANFSEALDLYRQLGETSSVSRLMLDLGAVYIDTGNLSEGLRCFNAVLEHYREEKNSYLLAGVLNDIAFLHHLRGEYEEADSAFNEGLTRARNSSNRRVEALVLTGMGDLYMDLDSFQAADYVYSKALEAAAHINDQFLLLYLYIAQSNLFRTTGNLIKARNFLENAKQLVERSESKYTRALYLMEAGMVVLCEKEPILSVTLLEEAVKLFEEIEQRVEICRTNFNLAVAHITEGNRDACVDSLERAFQTAQTLNNPHTLVPTARRVKNQLEAIANHPKVEGQISILLDSVTRFEQSIPTLRLRMKRQKTTGPLNAPTLQIRAFGAARVILNKKAITITDWQSQKARDLFFLMLSSDKGWSKEVLGELMWPDSTPSQLKLRFKNTIYRLRRVLGQEAILFDGERYMFNRNFDYSYDVELFVDCLHRIENAKTPQERAGVAREAMQYYTGQYLPEVNGAWTSVEREHLHQAFIELSLELASLNFDSGEFSDALTICHHLIANEPGLEEAHRVAMRIHAAQGNRAAVIQQYNDLKSTLHAQMGIPPSPITESLYRQLLQ